MSRTPHIYAPAPWPQIVLQLRDETRHHLIRVLRLGTGASVTYTDGRGTLGEGKLSPEGVTRGEESRLHPVGSPVIAAVAPPNRSERSRFLVEKLAELGVDHLVWLDTARGEGSPPPERKAKAWAVTALEQSRGAFLMQVSGPARPDDLTPPLVAAVPGGGAYPAGVTAGTFLVGPEGGWASAELPDSATTVDLGSRTLRTETAAVVLATLALRTAGRLGPA